MENEWPLDLSDEKSPSSQPKIQGQAGRDEVFINNDDSYDSWVAALNAPANVLLSEPEISERVQDIENTSSSSAPNKSSQDQSLLSHDGDILELSDGLDPSLPIKALMEPATKLVAQSPTKELADLSPQSQIAVSEVTPHADDSPQYEKAVSYVNDAGLSPGFTSSPAADIDTIEEASDRVDCSEERKSALDRREPSLGTDDNKQPSNPPGIVALGWTGSSRDTQKEEEASMSWTNTSQKHDGVLAESEEQGEILTSNENAEEKRAEPNSRMSPSRDDLKDAPTDRRAIRSVNQPPTPPPTGNSWIESTGGWDNTIEMSDPAHAATEWESRRLSEDRALDWLPPDDENTDARKSEPLSWTIEAHQPNVSDLPPVFPGDAIKDSESGNDLEDIWAKALGSPNEDLDNSWDAAFGEDFGEDGFLEDPPQEEGRFDSEKGLHQAISAPLNVYLPSADSSTSKHRKSSSSFVPPTAPAPVQQKVSAPPPDFFAELPIAQSLRPRRSRMQVMPQPQSPPQAPVLPGTARSGPPPPAREISTSQFRGPERLELFPPQPSVPPRSTSQNFASQFTSQPQPKVQSAPIQNLRYSPAPTQMSGPVRGGSRSISYNSHLSASLIPSNIMHQDDTQSRPSSQGSSLYGSSSTARQGFPPQDYQLQSSNIPVSSSRPAPTSRYSPAQLANTSQYQNQDDFNHGTLSNTQAIQHHSNSTPPPPRPFGPHVPRTSSPLTQSQHLLENSPTTSPRRKQSASHDGDRYISRNSPGDGLTSLQTMPKRGSIPSTLQDIPEFPLTGYPRSVTHQPQVQPHIRDLEQPPRPQTQSPEVLNDSAISMTPVINSSSFQSPAKSYRGSKSQNLHFIVPEDERATDPLQRWKGSPLFRWGPGGYVLSTFPRQIPRYGGNQSQPMLKCMPGEVSLRKLTEILPIEETFTSFPGPLKSKGKKKEVLAWLSSHINVLEKQIENEQHGRLLLQNDQAALEERTILWKLMRLLVGHDGILSGSQSVDQAVREVISPRTKSDPGVLHPAWVSNNEVPINTLSAAQADSVSPLVVGELRNNLINGDRVKAVWHAVDNRLWGHAMLISSTVSTDLWKQVSQEFVRKEVQSAQAGNKSLATLYEIFAGNREDCVDQLVPPSARAGFQMVSAAQGAGKSVDATSGLDQWRETLGLILSNRSVEDEKAINSLGKLLSGYGRTEAAHICFLFSRSASHFGGADDSQADFTLVGADHSKQTFEAIKDLDAILLSEVYEYALSLSPSTTYPNVPHLQAYKLSHAFALVEYGHRNDALQYCEALTNAMKSTTRPSQYYHITLINQVEDLYKRLSQTPKDGQSSWLPKAFSEKARGSLLAKFNSFIDPNDSEVSTGNGDSAANDFGPFARISSETPTISRSPSSADLYHQTGPGLLNQSSISATNSRYAPANYGHRPSQEYERQNSSPYGSYSPSTPSYMSDVHNSQRKQSPYDPNVARQMNGIYSSSPSQNLLQPEPLLSQAFSQPQSSHRSSQTSYEPYVPTASEESAVQLNFPAEQSGPQEDREGMLSARHETERNDDVTNGFTSGSQPWEAAAGDVIPSNNSNDFASNSYQPSTGGYEPPSYQPYQPDIQVDDDESSDKPRKRSSVLDDNDDDDLAKKAADMKKQDKARKDREADDAVRRAAEVDAKRDLNKKPSGWLGGWFGKKDGSSTTVHKVKLGEESSFFYDPETKKWVNKKVELIGGAPAAPTPPPPKSRVPSASGPPGAPPSSGPPSRPPTSSGPPQAQNSTTNPIGAILSAADASSSGPTSRAGTPLSQSSTGAVDVAAPPTGPPASNNSPAAMPPSRPSTGMSNASSIDDLLGAPAPRKGGTVKGKKRGGRYVDVMASKT